MKRKFKFYDSYGVEEYYLYNPYKNEWTGWLRGKGGRLRQVPHMAGWISPRLKVRFEMKAGDLELYHPDGRRFATYLEVAKRGEQAEQRADRLAAQLRALGIDPEA